MFYASAAALYGSIITLLTLDFFVVVLRFLVRRKLHQKLMLDDWLMIPVLLGLIGMASVYINVLINGTLGHRWMVPVSPNLNVTGLKNFHPAQPTDNRIQLTRRLEYSILVIFSVTSGLLKISVLAMYKRIFVVAPSWGNSRYVSFVFSMILMAIWAISYTFAYIFACGTNFSIIWYAVPKVVLEKCVDSFRLSYSHSISDFITDSLVIIIPLPFVWQLHLSPGRKIAICFVFLLGALSVAGSCVRMAFMIWGTQIGTRGGADGVHESNIVAFAEPCTYCFYWINLEIAVGVIAACLPTLRGLIKESPVDCLFRCVQGIFSLGSDSSTRSLNLSEISKDPQGNTLYHRAEASNISIEGHRAREIVNV